MTILGLGPGFWALGSGSVCFLLGLVLGLPWFVLGWLHAAECTQWMQYDHSSNSVRTYVVGTHSLYKTRHGTVRSGYCLTIFDAVEQ